jgi:hypothetical protein
VSGAGDRELGRLTWGAVTLDERGAVISLDAANSRKGSRARANPFRFATPSNARDKSTGT